MIGRFELLHNNICLKKMDLSIFIQGLIIGFSIAAPVGPIGVLCIRRTLTEGRLSGFVSGLGAATADAVYGSIAGFGLTFISIFLIERSQWLRLIGGGFLLYLGIRTFLAKTKSTTDPDYSIVQRGNLTGNYFSTFGLTLTNPLTILSFAAIFAGLGIGSTSSRNYLSAFILVIGVFLGSSSWWFLLSGIVVLFRQRIKSDSLIWVNRISGVIIIIFGIAALLSLL
jgi:threonine/homoserine/homoserine lactone efflux protein